MDSRDDKPADTLTQIGKYEVVGVLGRGGMGVVYRCVDSHLGREVAIKTLTEGVKSDPAMLARFYEEGRKTGNFSHPNIVTVYELGDDKGIPYIVMELVEGDPLDKLIAAEEQLPLAERLRIMADVCSALGYAHGQNVIHRDVKPANIFVQPDGRVKLLDFGIARPEERKEQDLSLTRRGRILGTVEYMAPEQLTGKPLDRRSDIFAAGVVLYQLVCGELPFSGDEIVLMRRILNEPHPPLSGKCKGCPASLDAIADRALAKSPADRYSTADEMAADLTTTIAEIQEGQAQELLPEAKRLMEAQDLPRARAALQQLLKMQSKHTEARELLAEIQRQLSQRQREERIQQLRRQAEGLLNDQEFDKSLAILDEGLELDAANRELIELRGRVEKGKEKQERVREYLRQADAARRAGDYKTAISAAREALQLDESNSKGIVLVSLLTKEAEEAGKRADVKTLLEAARRELSLRRYKEAIEVLQKAAQADAANPEIPILLEDANFGLEQIKRKELIARLETEVLAAASLEDLERCAQSVQEALASLPTDTTLIRLNAQVDRQIGEQENRRFVEETIQACRDLRPKEALKLVQEARQRVPGEERLQGLEKLLADRVKRQTEEERREEIVSQAREALAGGKYADAVRILEGCQAEGIATDEILSLLEFARREEEEHRSQALTRSRVAQAQALIGESAYEEAIAFLESALKENDDKALRFVHEQALEGRASLLKQVEAELANAGKLAREGKQAEAIEYLEALPPALKRSERVQAAESALREERQGAIFRTIGRAYSVLETGLPAGEQTMRRAAAALGDSTLAGSVAETFQGRMRAFADRAVAGLTGKYKIMMDSGDRAGAAELATKVAGIVDYAGPEAKSAWESLAPRPRKIRTPARLSR
jgi:serine/threonine-protein kinase